MLKRYRTEKGIFIRKEINQLSVLIQRYKINNKMQ